MRSIPDRRIYRLALVLLAVTLLAPHAAGQVAVERLEEIVERLSDPALDGRRAGTPGSRAAADFILEEFRRMGLDAGFQPMDATRRNVVARLDPAEDTTNGNEHIVIGAHYDGQGVGMPGASDNAAGVAVMLALAGELASDPPDVGVLFVAFDDEEQGLNGSRFYTRNPALPLDTARAAIILDTMGRSFIDLERWSLIVMGTERSPAIARIVDRRAGGETITLGTDLIGARSDYAPFADRGVPFLFFTNATHEDYHGSDDDPGQIRYDELAGDARFIEAVIRDIGALEHAPVFLTDPVYPDGEASSLGEIMDRVEAERGGLAENYAILFDDLRRRFAGNPSRVELRLAAEILLAAATPRFAFFPLGFTVGPLYESEGRMPEALAAYREAVRLAPDATTRQLIESKIDALSGR